MVFSPEFKLGIKIQNSAFWNISDLGLCYYSVALNINFKSDEPFEVLKFTENVN